MWTKTPPDTAGWYWLRSGDDMETMHAVEVLDYDGKLEMYWVEGHPYIAPDEVPGFYEAEWWSERIETPGGYICQPDLDRDDAP